MSDTMDLMYSEETSLFGGNLLEEVPQMWGPEVALFEGKVDMSTSSWQTAPQKSKEASLSEIDCGLPSPSSDWMSDKMDLSALEDLVGTDFVKLVSAGAVLGGVNSKNCLPPSPNGSYDSGVASPGSSASYTSRSPSYNSAGSPTSSLDAFDTNFAEQDNFLVQEIFDVNTYYNVPVSLQSEQPTSEEDLEISEELLSELGIELLPEVPEASISSLSPIDIVPENVPLPAEQTPSLVEIDPSSLNEFLPNHSISNFSNTSELCTLLTTDKSSCPSPAHSLPSPAIAEARRPGRKSKISSTQERKQRKRDQNKNAATRYRERKRQETSQREGEFTELDTKNKSLQDKVTQLSREIDYLKELMIEVYTIKGLIP